MLVSNRILTLTHNYDQPDGSITKISFVFAGGIYKHRYNFTVVVLTTSVLDFIARSLSYLVW